MDYLSAFAISGSGMNVEKVRLDATAVNLANVHSTRSVDGQVYKPLQVISAAKQTLFDSVFSAAAKNLSGGAEVVQLRSVDVPPRMVYEPSHPDANEKGFVAYPGINQVTEMVNLITTVRAYEANLSALNAAKTMALRALDIGGNQ